MTVEPCTQNHEGAEFMKYQLIAYLNHALMNFGGAFRCLWLVAVNLWYALLPPQWTGHTEKDIDSLASYRPRRAFLAGLLSQETSRMEREI